MSRLIHPIAATDTHDARRRRLLNILILGVAGVTMIGMLGVAVVGWLGPPTVRVRIVLLAGGLLEAGLLVIYWLNRRAGVAAAVIFVVLLVVINAFTDEPAQVADGRSLFIFAIPILVSAAVLPPWASFVTAGVCSLVIFGLAEWVTHTTPNVVAAAGFFVLAFVAWLTAANLERALDREIELSRMKSELISMASHELRTPIAAIQGYTEKARIVLTTLPGGDALAGDLQRVLYNCKRLGTLVEALLAQARLQGGMFTLDEGPVVVRELVGDLLTSVGLAAQDKGLALTVQVDDDVPAVIVADRKALLQVLVNLVDNAIKFTDHGGVTVRISRPDAGHWALAVTDTGIGIPKEARELIFEPFRTAHNVIARRHQGAGLGLSIVREFVRVMGGRIALESEEGHGSTFTVTLPLREGG